MTLPVGVGTGTVPPSSASARVIGTSVRRSAPSRSNRGSGLTFTSMTRSPPSTAPVSFTFEPSRTPAGIFTCRRLPLTLTIRSAPLATSASVTSAVADARATFGRAVARPRAPPTIGQVDEVEAAPARPPSAKNCRKKSLKPPRSSADEVRYVQRVPPGAPPKPAQSVAPPEPNPACWYACQFAPSSSYCLRFSGSVRTAWASLASLKRRSASGSLFVSGWSSRASLR